MASVYIRDGRGSEQTMRTSVVGTDNVAHSVREWQAASPRILHRYLSNPAETGGTDASINAVGNYSITPADFRLEPGPTEVFQVAALLVHIRDADCSNSGSYGGISALTNGINIVVTDNANGPLYSLTLPTADPGDGGPWASLGPIKTNADWGHYGGIDAMTSVFASGDEWINVIMRFDLSGTYLRVDGASDYSFQVELNDDFTGLTRHTFLAYGLIETTTD
jgi:hypothetical protein